MPRKSIGSLRGWWHVFRSSLSSRGSTAHSQASVWQIHRPEFRECSACQEQQCNIEGGASASAPRGRQKLPMSCPKKKAARPQENRQQKESERVRVARHSALVQGNHQPSTFLGWVRLLASHHPGPAPRSPHPTPGPRAGAVGGAMAGKPSLSLSVPWLEQSCLPGSNPSGCRILVPQSCALDQQKAPDSLKRHAWEPRDTRSEHRILCLLW